MSTREFMKGAAPQQTSTTTNTNSTSTTYGPGTVTESYSNKTTTTDTYDSGEKVTVRYASGANPLPTAAVSQTYTPPNSYAHTNTVPGTDRLKTDFRPNVLDFFDSYTYHWKLFITSLPSAYSGDVLRSENQTIIAESGVSDLTIDNVELQGITTPSIESGTGTQTTIKFEIFEPAGAGLLDKLFYEAVALGHGNWLVMPVYLQLDFKGRVPETSESVATGSPGPLSGLRWVWPIKITDAKAKVSEIGTKYEFSAVKYDELAQSNSYFSLQHNITLDSIESFGQTMKNLEDKLNLDQYVKLIDNYSIPDVYKIVVDPVLENIPLILTDKARHTMRNADYVKFDKKTASFTAGTSIDKIVDTLLGNSEHYQKQLPAAETRNGEAKDAESAPTLRKLWRIVTESRPIGYDFMRQDNAVEVTIFITEYNLGLVETDANQTAQKSEVSKKRFKDYLTKGILKKQYNYIFTGLNDQILNLDLNMNFSFAAALSRFGGVYYESGIGDKGPKNNEDAKEQIEKLNKQVSETIRFVNSAGANAKDSDKRIAEATAALNKSVLDESTRNRYIALLNKSKPATRTTFTNQIVEGQGIERTGAVSSKPVIKGSLSPAVGDTSLRFISDVNSNSAAAKIAMENFENTKKGKLRPTAFRETAQEATLAGSIDTSNDAARSRISSVFSTALYSTLDASLQTLKFTIKGDPFWLFPEPTPVDQKKLRINAENIKTDKQGVFDYFKTLHLKFFNANQIGTDNFILLRFRTPRIYNELSGQNDPYTDVDTFSGVYKVITITSKFSGGKFTQELSCILDPLLDIKDIREFISFIEQGVRLQGIRAIGILEGESLPNLSIKTQRINSLNLPKGIGDLTTIPKLPPLGG